MPKLWNETIEIHREAVRRAVLDAAARLVAGHGVSGVTMSAIAQSAGIGRATLYKYFPDVESILVAWHERQVESHLAELMNVKDRFEGRGNSWRQCFMLTRSFPAPVTITATQSWCGCTRADTGAKPVRACRPSWRSWSGMERPGACSVRTWLRRSWRLFAFMPLAPQQNFQPMKPCLGWSKSPWTPCGPPGPPMSEFEDSFASGEAEGPHGVGPIRQCSCMLACCSHSSAQALQAVAQAWNMAGDVGVVAGVTGKDVARHRHRGRRSPRNLLRADVRFRIMCS